MLITGAGGFVGGHCVRGLYEAGFSVLALLRKAKPIAGMPAENDRFRYIYGDLTQDIDCPYPVQSILHLAAQVVLPGVSAEQYVIGNIMAAAGALHLAERLNVPQMIFHSTVSVYGSSPAPVYSEDTPVVAPKAYGASKYLCELLAEEEAASRNITVIRTPGIIGTHANPNWVVGLVDKAVKNEPITIQNPNAAFNTTLHVQDYVAFVEKFLKTPEGKVGYDIVNLACNKPAPVKDMVAVLIKETGSSSSVKINPAQSSVPLIDVAKVKNVYGFMPMSVIDAVSLYARQIKTSQ